MKKGFMLVEFIVVMLTIGIMVCDFIPAVLKYKENCRNKIEEKVTEIANFTFKDGTVIQYPIANCEGCEYFMIPDGRGHFIPVHKGNCTSCYPVLNVEVEDSMVKQLEKQEKTEKGEK